MARMEFSGTDELMAQLYAETEKLEMRATEMLGAAGEYAAGEWRTAIERAQHAPPGKSGRATGDLMASVRASKPRKKGDRYEISIYPQGKDRHGQRMADIAFSLHYGTSRIRGDHFVDDAEENIGQNVFEIMADVWEKSE